MNRFLLALVACAAISPGVAQASLITQTNASGDVSGFTVSATDLVNLGSSSLRSATRSHAPMHGNAGDVGYHHFTKL